MRSPRLARVAAAAVIFASTLVFGPGCGILFHPERSRNHSNSGHLAFGSLILDCLWLIVGVVPGVVFLIIDFVSGGAFLQSDEVMAPDGLPHNYCVKKAGGDIVLWVDGRPRAKISPARPWAPEAIEATPPVQP